MTSALVDAAVNAYASQQRDAVHEAVNDYISEAGEMSSEAVVQFIRKLINRKREVISVDDPVPHSEARCVDDSTQLCKPVSAA